MTITNVQQVTANTTTVTIAATGSGNLLVVVINSENTTAAASISSVKLGTASLTLDTSKSTSFGTIPTRHFDSFIYHLEGIASGQTSIAITGTNLGLASGTGGVTVYEFNGVVGSSALDKVSNGSSTTTAFSSGATATLSQSNEVAVGGVESFSNTITPPGSPWVNVSEGTGAESGYNIVSATTGLAYSGTTSGNNSTAVIATYLGSAGVTVNLPLLQKTVNAPPLKPPIYVNLTLLHETRNVPSLTPLIPVLVNLPVLHKTQSISAFTPTITPVPPRLIIALASLAGTDPLSGVNYPQGLLETAGQTLIYNGAPTLGNLVISISQNGGVDSVGNVFQPGVVVYNITNGTWAQLNTGALAFANGGVLSNALSGILNLNNNNNTAVVLNNNTNEIDLNATRINANGNNVTGLFNNLDPSGLPLSPSATLGAVISAVNSMFQRFQNMQVFQ